MPRLMAYRMALGALEECAVELGLLQEKASRLGVLAVKHCPRGHHDFQEILSLTEQKDHDA
jgi:hypothetical protein